MKKLQYIAIPDPDRPYTEGSGDSQEKWLIGDGFRQIAYENGYERWAQPTRSTIYIRDRFASPVHHYTYNEYTDAYFMFYRDRGISREQILDPTLNIIHLGDHKYKAVPISESLIKTLTFKVTVVEEDGSVLQGQKELKQYGLLPTEPYKIDPREESIVNIVELANYYANLDCLANLQDYDPANPLHLQDFERYYNIHLKTINSFKLNKDDEA